MKIVYILYVRAWGEAERDFVYELWTVQNNLILFVELFIPLIFWKNTWNAENVPQDGSSEKILLRRTYAEILQKGENLTRSKIYVSETERKRQFQTNMEKSQTPEIWTTADQMTTEGKHLL